MTNLRRLSLAAMAAATGVTFVPLEAEIIKETAPLRTQIEGPVVMPADTRDHLLFVTAMVNGRGPFRMFVDTGCSFTLVTPELAAAVNARTTADTDADAAALNSLGEIVALPLVLLDSVELGRARFEGVVAAIAPFSGLAMIDGIRVDGALGFSFFSEVLLGLDYPGSRLLLTSRWPEGLPPLRAEMHVREHSEVPFVMARVQGRALEVQIDSGANGGMRIPGDLAAELSWKAEPRPGPLVEAVGDEERDYIGRLAGRLTVGELEQIEPVVSIGGRLPALGYDILHRYCVVFDQRSDLVRFYSKEAGTIPAPSERSVGLSLKRDPAGWRVAGVIPGSPAEEAHLAAGDLVARIEGRRATDWARDQIHDWVENHEAMALVVSTPSGSRKVRLRVWSLVP